MDLLGLLAQQGVIKQSDIPGLKSEAASKGESLEATLTRRGIPVSDILAAKGKAYGIPIRELGNDRVPFDVLKHIPEESALHYRLAPLAVKDGALEVGVIDPDNLEARDALSFISSKSGLPFKIFLISEADLERVLDSYKGLTGEVGKALSELDTELAVDEEDGVQMSRISSADPEEEKAAKVKGAMIVEDAPVTKIVATIIRYASEGRASDIHIEPTDSKLRVRFRVDGALATSLLLPLKVHSAVVARVKILSNMKLDEKRKPQDGRFTAKIEGRRVDFRVSTFPTYYGEKVVMRILDTERGVRPLSELGFSEENLKLLRTAIKKPYGMVLISGPTGSGKSTTLYSMLNEIDRETRNVVSLEDPVEYNIPGMNQSQVRPEIDYSFATGLRSILRQDPDIIMVGEIRDKETAQLAVQAALTGHLVLSTIHTNDSVGVIPRLLDMGIDPYLIPPTVILAIAQRLVRTLCPGGGKKIPVEGSVKAMLEKQFADLPAEHRKKLPPLDSVYRLNPTDDCPNGTRGRMAVFEVLEMTREIEQAVLKKQVVEEELYGAARARGMLTMREDAIIKSAQGIVPFEEVNTLGGEFELAE